MTQRVDPNILTELKAFGAMGIEKCTNCGNCTAICPMASEDEHFPRYMIRLAQIGMKDELLGSKELWLCYNCGDCSETCPQQAEPANFMAAARCYAVTHFAPLKIGYLFCRTPLLGGFITVLMVLFFGIFFYGERQTVATDSLKLFHFIPRDLVHNAGLAAMILIGLVSLMTIFTMLVRIARVNNLSFRNFFNGTRMNWVQAFWEAVVVQSLAQKRYREKCEPSQNSVKWYFSKWFVHAATMWGFLGLLLATALNFLLDILGVKATGTFVPLWYPTRLIGTLSGLLFMYGVMVLLVKRWRSADKAHSFSRPSDWIFLILLWLSGMTGFIIEIALYLPGAPLWGYWMFIFHMAVSLVLLLLLPFTKFAHAIYRIVALYVHALKPVAKPVTAPASAD
ncbi:MAG: 4Fe-4S dicluster domain-containing protein [Anaerolineaceae bacterium]|nr:4Fe-4S dicluster domain-containing protein [Anaerolineaceae bacterium]MBN2677589.1 4Fe-4S dicluster domain-containing protein [Anaerolineaceae bacterium]